MRRLLLFLLLLGMTGPPAAAISFYFAPDVPTTLGGVTYMPSDIVRSDSGVYSLAASAVAGSAIDSVFRMNNGDWLLSFEAPVTVPPATFDPRDVVRFNGVSYAVFFDGAAAGVPAGSNVDAAFLDGGDAGTLVLSFDVPTTIAGVTYQPADLVKYKGGAFGFYLDSSTTVPPIPTYVNVVGADRMGSQIVLAFDVPAPLAVPDYMPGQVAAWNGAVFSSLYADPTWPPGSVMNALSLLADPGEVGPSLMVTLASPTQITLDWSVGCSPGGAEDYGIYEGTIGSWYSHTQVGCHDGGTPLTETIFFGSGNRYYLVVAKNPNGEGSYGRSSAGVERPVGGAVCAAPQVLGPCP
jgi:hypothetical protein